MILPGSQLFNLILLAVGMLCWGLWANTFRMTSKWRFELYYFDFAVGALVASLILGFTAGSLGWDGFALIDDLRIAGKRQEATAAAAGIVFNLGNMAILGALSVTGVTVAYFIGISLMLTVGIDLLYFTAPSGNGPMVAIGTAIIVVAAVTIAVCSRLHSMARLVALMREGKTKSTKKVVKIKGLIMAAIGGLVAAGCFPLINLAREGENGVGPYSLGLCFAVGIVFSTFVFNLFFMNLPVQGEPIELSDYFTGSTRSHWLGMLGGVLWYIGLAALLIVARAEGHNILPPIEVRGLMMAVPFVGAAFGLLRWREYNGVEPRIRMFLALAVLLFLAGAVALTMGAGFGTGA